MPGQDSFLDVITNIVGILILLVMIVGVRSVRARHSATIDQSAANPHATQQIHAAYAAATNNERELRKLIQRYVSTHQEVQLRDRERLILNTVVAQAEQEIAQRRSELDSQDRRDFDIRRQLSEAKLTLDDLTREQMALMTEEPDVEEIQCEPTPLARVVSGKEVHLLLADDHVAVVPFDELLELLKADAEANVWRLRDQDELERTVGPVNDFRLRYWFVKAALVARNANTGTVVAGQFPRFSHCFFIPVTTPAGEPAADAMRPNSEMRQFLGRLNPQGTTVTIWTYAGNYDRLREVKRAIRELGFQIALRPLPKGMPIGASRTGTESVTE
jgi:hypothetical protein